MIVIKEKESINKIWKKVLSELYKTGFIPNDDRFARMESLNQIKNVVVTAKSTTTT